MSKPTANQRMFAAIYPPAWAVEVMFEALDKLDLPPAKRPPVDQVHMTLQFIGDVPTAEVRSVIESVERSAAGIRDFPVQPTRLISLPDKGPARLVAMETDSPGGLMEMHRRLAVRLAAAPRPKHEDQFLPHITLCRYDAEVRGSAQGARVNELVEMDEFIVDRLCLMKSVLRPEGAQHALVAEFELESRR